jgi:hypothetical protein
MRKSLKRKLSLHRETLRLLQSDVLRVARGAGTFEIITTCACTEGAGCGGGGTGTCGCGSAGCGSGGCTDNCTRELVTTCVC